MKREFLEGLGLDKETVDKIMAENGADLEREKAKTNQEKADLADAQQQLADLKQKYDADTGALNAKLAERDYADAITRAIAGRALKFSSKAAERDFIASVKGKKLELKDGELTGLDDFIKAQRESDPEAFAPEKEPPRFITSGSGGGHGMPSAPVSRAAQLAAEHHASLYGGEAKKE